MKLLRITLDNYRGVHHAEIRPAPRGVTVVLGPNEVGKSSLREALHLVFQSLHDSKHRDVMAVKPVHEDVGARIEVEIESGPYHFVYEKQFHRQARTKLEVLRPKPESWTGREAHERATKLLEETLDIALWKALSVTQGEAQKPVALTDQTWLSRAFDRAAGTATSGKSEESLYERARAERELYFTQNGKEKEPLTAPRARIVDLETELTRCATVLASLEQDIEGSARLKLAVLRDTQALAREQDELNALQLELASLQSARDVHERAVLAEQSAANNLLLVERDAEDRRKLEVELRDALAAHADLERRTVERTPELEVLLQRREQARAEARRANDAAGSAREHARLCASDHVYLRDLHDLGDLQQRRANLDEAEAELARVRAVEAGLSVDQKTLENLRKSKLELTIAETKATAASARLVLRAARELELEIDGEMRSVVSNEEFELRGDRNHRVVLAGALAFELHPGSDAASLLEQVERARQTLRELLQAARVVDLAAAERAFAERNEARAAAKTLERRIAEQLKDLTRETMNEKIARLKGGTETYLARRGSDAALPQSTTAAGQRSAEAEETRKLAEHDAAAADLVLREVEQRAATLESAHRSLAGDLEHARARCERARAALEAAAARETNDALDARRRTGASALATARAELRAAQNEIERRDPVSLETRESNKRRAVESLRGRVETQRTELTKLESRLEAHGQEGLAEQREDLERHIAASRDELARTNARAAAAKLLFDTLHETRESERRAYVAPLEQRIASLGRVVFGPTFQVTLDDELFLQSRTLDSVTVPFESLSTGAKEQLGVLTRLACALIVASDGGMPLILDDVLGHTDPDRLDKMAAVLHMAAKETQVLLMTSSPERYRGIGGAHFIELARTAKAEISESSR